MTYIYILIDPITNQIRYVGKTNNPEERYKNHKNRCRDKNTHKRNWINKLRLSSMNPDMEIIDHVKQSEWKYWEKFWIAYYKAIGCNLTNYCDGGEGLTYGNQTSFKRGSIPHNKGRGIVIKQCNQCSKEFRSHNSLNKNFCSKECRYKYISEHSNSGNFKQNHSSWIKGKKGIKLKPDKAVYQYSALTGLFIQKWRIAKEASISLHINEESIGQCARGKSKTAGGYIWTYNNTVSVPIITYSNKTNNKTINKLK